MGIKPEMALMPAVDKVQKASDIHRAALHYIFLRTLRG